MKKATGVIFPGCDFEESANYTIYSLQKRPIMDKRERASPERQRSFIADGERNSSHSLSLSLSLSFSLFLSLDRRRTRFESDGTRHTGISVPSARSFLGDAADKETRVRCTRSEGTEEGN